MTEGEPCSEADLLKIIRREYWPRPRVKKGIVTGTSIHPHLPAGHSVYTGECEDKKLHQLMDDLYDTYRMDPGTANGICVMPVIETLRREQRSEFHLYATQEQVVKGFFFLFYMEFSNTVKPVPTMTFVWVVPKFRRQGLFQQMYSDAIQGHGIIWIDAPNEPCQYALKKAGWTPRALLDQYEKAS